MGIALTNLLAEHLPFETTQILHRPNIVSPLVTLLSTNDLGIEHSCDSFRKRLVKKLDPCFGEVGLLVSLVLLRCGGVISAGGRN